MTEVIGKTGEHMKNHALTQAIKHWHYIEPIMHYPKNDKEYKKLVSRLDDLLDYIGDDENHSLIGLVDMLGHVIETYEQRKKPKQINKGLSALKYLMQINGLSQNDLKEIASQGVISEILNGKRELNVRQIKLLAKRFHVSVETFIDEDEI